MRVARRRNVPHWEFALYHYDGAFRQFTFAGTDAGFLRFLLSLEDGLIDLAAQSYREMGQALPPKLVKRTEAERARLLASPI